MRRSTNVMYATLAVVALVTILAVAIALVRSSGEDEHEDAEHSFRNESTTDSSGFAGSR